MGRPRHLERFSDAEGRAVLVVYLERRGLVVAKRSDGRSLVVCELSEEEGEPQAVAAAREFRSEPRECARYDGPALESRAERRAALAA